MKNALFRYRLCTGLALLIAMLSLVSCGESQSRLLITSQAWNFRLPDLRGDTVALVDHENKVRLIVFWASWCTPCLMEIPTLIQLQEELGPQGFQVLSINLDEEPQKAMPAMLQRFRFNYPILLGNAEVVRQYGNVAALPTSFLIDGKGKIREVILGLRTEDALRKLIQGAFPRDTVPADSSVMSDEL